MKKLKFVFAFLVVSFFAITMAKSQAIVYEGQTWMWITDYGVYITNETHEVYAPNGNVSIILYFYLDLDDPYVPEKGVNKVYLGYWEIWINTDGVALAKYQVNGKDKKTLP